MSDWLSDVISYNRGVALGAIYNDQIVFAQMHRLFDNFVTVGTSKEPWMHYFGLADKSFNIDIPSKKGHLEQKISSSDAFANVAKGMPHRKFILYSPLDPPYPVNPLTYIMNSPTIAHAYEHKRYFRDEFADLVKMPPYTTHRLDELTPTMFKELKSNFGKFVIQDVESSGSKGTFVVANEKQYDYAVAALRKNSISGMLVVSQFVKGLPCSVQVCVTKYGIFTGGLQKQLVNSQYLCNNDLPNVAKWCGGELGGETSEIVKHRTQEIATVIGSELASHGYRGIFGIDLIITPDSDVYSIEINARLTGYSHILSDMQYAANKIPFMLLHTLELGNYKYEVEDLEALPSMYTLTDKYSYLILNNMIDGAFKLATEIKTGLYRLDAGKLTYIKPSYSVVDIKDEKYILIFSKYSKGDTVERGKRIMKLVKKGGSMSAAGDLDVRSQKMVSAIKEHFLLPG